jgi:hypothetical protein
MYLLNFKDITKLISLYMMSNSIAEIKGVRLSSFPFISGDTFRLLADIKLDNPNDFNTLPSIVVDTINSIQKPIVIFVSLSSIEKVEDQEKLLMWAAHLRNIYPSKIKYILHNGDSIPQSKFYYSLKKLSDQIYSVNILDFCENIYPIPIGLENLHHQKNGNLKTFLENDKSHLIVSLQRKKSRLIFSCFNSLTNENERNGLVNLLNRYGIQNYERLSPIDFKNQVLKSAFVICPTGNGLDTHRIWESILLGSVPVVKKNYLADSLINKLPILAVENWEDFLDLNDFEKMTVFEDLSKKPRDYAHIFPWINMIMN